MTTKKISDLTVKSTPVGTDELELQETAAGASRKATLQTLVEAVKPPITALTLKSSPIGTDELELQETGAGNKRKATLTTLVQAIRPPIASLTEKTAPVNTDEFELQETGAGASRKATLTHLRDLVLGGIFHASSYASLQAAITAAEAAAGTVYVPAGTYNITTSLSVSVGGITIYLAAGAVLQAANQLTTGVINITASNVTLCGPGKINGNNQFSTYGVYAVGTISNIKISDIEIINTTNDALLLKGTDTSNRLTNSTVKNVYIHDVYEGLLLWYANDCQVIGCRSYDMNVGSSQDCFETSDCFRVLFLGCVARNPGPSNSCFDIYNACEDIIVQGCQALQNASIATGPAIQVTSTGTVGKRISILGNLIKGTVTTTQGATSSGVGLDTRSFDGGIWASKGTDILIRGNTIIGCCNTITSVGLLVSNGVTSISVVDNVIAQTSSAAVQVTGAAAMEIRIVGNTFRNSHWDTNTSVRAVLNFDGVQPAQWIVMNNHFSNDTPNLDALYYIEGNSGNFQNGTIRGNTSDGGLAAGGSNNPVWVDVTGNYFSDNKFYDQNRVGTVQSYSQNAGTTGTFSASTKVVTHGLHRVTPLAGQISITPISLGSGAIPVLWTVGTIGLTTFTLNLFDVTGAPVTPTNAEFGWKVDTTIA